ncbi:MULTISPECIES: tRNA dihydrouridine synthase DusB [unclassified Halanaerobium]|uniref:tRNA dihydrouridine synthase DusB n=1 Tax=unclassified Halanaerobium TaxID=2641197 RepID=UPI000DF317D6|nr:MULTISPECIES: tRNA dihydrouridine synthase DusB [unclassified Halanaerobium]RCW40561.1 tRNA-U20-dihydrouridine synthase [Halanaerobium sp. MA284_MarDTE_T2]RCW78547.1 tRNA-U20-dihydrouridine synthase [Halanaerobium sp. DL-01]
MLFRNLNIDKLVFLAPMAGVSDYPYRQIVRDMGCQLVYTEMVSAKGYIYGNEKTKELLRFNRKNGKIGVQIFGEEADIIAEAAQKIEEKYQPDLIDINIGCPARKIVKTGAGSALMKNPERVYEIISSTVKNTELPITVKIRTGWNKENINAVEIAEIAESAGASAVAVHGRTREQFYKGRADWSIIKSVSENIDIPVIGNGDIFSGEDAEKMIKQTSCQAVMIGRAAQGNPWIFREIISYLYKNKKIERPKPVEIIEMAVDHLKKSVEYYGEKYGIPIMRKHISWYLKGLPNASEMKNRVNQIKEKEKLISLLNSYKKEFKEDIYF